MSHKINFDCELFKVITRTASKVLFYCHFSNILHTKFIFSSYYVTSIIWGDMHVQVHRFLIFHTKFSKQKGDTTTTTTPKTHLFVCVRHLLSMNQGSHLWKINVDSNNLTFFFIFCDEERKTSWIHMQWWWL